MFLPILGGCVAPETCLCPERLDQRVVGFFAVDERREPNILAGVRAPAVKIEVVGGLGLAAVAAVEAHDVIILVFYPNPTDKAPFVALRYRVDVENQTANLPKELASDVIKIVMLAVEPGCVHVDHLEETAGEKFHRDKSSQAAKHAVLRVTVRDQGFDLYAFRELRAPKIILIAFRNRTMVLVRTEHLDVGFHDGRVLVQRLHFRLFLGHNPVHNFSQLRRLLGKCSQRERAQRQRDRQYLQGTHNAS